MQELIGVASNRLIRMDLSTGHTVTTWRFSSMKTWRVNWEVLHLIVCFDDEEVSFQSLSADCKIVHEFIGGYIFLSMRSGEKNQSLNEDMFHKLTGGRS
jgi:kindlin 2